MEMIFQTLRLVEIKHLFHKAQERPNYPTFSCRTFHCILVICLAVYDSVQHVFAYLHNPLPPTDLFVSVTHTTVDVTLFICVSDLYLYCTYSTEIVHTLFQFHFSINIIVLFEEHDK
jgi:hypothetical protein